MPPHQEFRLLLVGGDHLGQNVQAGQHNRAAATVPDEILAEAQPTPATVPAAPAETEGGGADHLKGRAKGRAATAQDREHADGQADGAE